MLYLYHKTDTLPDLEVIEDPIEWYDRHGPDLESDTQLLFRLIEKGELKTKTFYIDRFGYKVSAYDVSAGFKSAFTVLRNPDKLVYCFEMGTNAVDALIAVCKNGYAVVITSYINMNNLGYAVDVMFEGNYYTSLEDDVDEG